MWLVLLVLVITRIELMLCWIAFCFVFGRVCALLLPLHLPTYLLWYCIVLYCRDDWVCNIHTCFGRDTYFVFIIIVVVVVERRISTVHPPTYLPTERLKSLFLHRSIRFAISLQEQYASGQPLSYHLLVLFPLLIYF